MMNKLQSLSILSILYLPIISSISLVQRQMLAYKRGDVILAGLFPAHLSWDESCTDRVNMKGIALIEAMMYTVNTVNTNNLLPCKLTLGYDVRDTCSNKKTALEQTLSFLSENYYSSINNNDNDSRICGKDKSYECHGKLLAVIGAGDTELSIAVNKILSAFDIPQMGYVSTSGVLSDKSRFPTFSRTVVVGANRPHVIVKILTRFKWKRIGLIVSEDMHWKSLALEFKNLAGDQQICIEIDEQITDNSKTIESVVDKVKSSNNTHVFVIFASFEDANLLFKKASDINLMNKVWINTEKLPPDVVTKYGNTLQGMFAIEREPEALGHFSKYFTELNPVKNTWNPWFKILWKKLFGCPLIKSQVDQVDDNSNSTICSGNERFKWIGEILSFSHAIHVIDSVMAITHVIKNICHDLCKNSTGTKNDCLKRLNDKKQVLDEIFKGPFTYQSLFNKTVSLDKNGNAAGSYGVYHVKQTFSGIHFLKAGLYTSSTDSLYINNSVIQWPRQFNPARKCNTPCTSGYYRDFENSKCCWKCKACPIGTFSKQTNAKKCLNCPKDTYSNSERTSCIKRLPKSYNWDTTGGMTLTIISLFSFCFTLVAFCILVKHRTSPVVCGWGSSVNFYLVISISIGVLVPFVFIGYPTQVMCKLQAVMIPTTLALSLSLLLVKTKQITCKKKYLISRWRVLSYAQRQTIYALFFTIVEILFCALWIIISPPTLKVIDGKEKIILCSNRNASWYVLSFIYIVTISFFITFKSCKARNNAFNFSEAKCSLYAMICIYILWGVYLAIFIGTPTGFRHITLLCLTTIATQLLILLFIFIPKIMIVMFRPEMAKLCEFQVDEVCLKDQMGYDACNTRSLHPNGMIRSTSSFKDDSSVRGSPSQLSLDVSSTNYPNAITPAHLNKNSLIERIAQLPCCAVVLRDDESSVVSEQHRPGPFIQHRLPPIITIDEGTRSNSPRSQLSERTFVPNSTHKQRHKSLEDQEQECLSAAMDDTEVWSKRRPLANNKSPGQSVGNSEEHCLRFAVKGHIIENKHSKSNHQSNHQLRESRL